MRQPMRATMEYYPYDVRAETLATTSRTYRSTYKDALAYQD